MGYQATIIKRDNVPRLALIQRPKTTKFLLNMAKAMSENKLSMDVLAKTPVTKQDLFSDVIVVPL